MFAPRRPSETSPGAPLRPAVPAVAGLGDLKGRAALWQGHCGSASLTLCQTQCLPPELPCPQQGATLLTEPNNPVMILSQAASLGSLVREMDFLIIHSEPLTHWLFKTPLCKFANVQRNK